MFKINKFDFLVSLYIFCIAVSELMGGKTFHLFDIGTFIRVRVKLVKKKLLLRNNVSNFVSQFFDTSVFMFLAFYAVDKSISSNMSFLFSLILPYWLLKCFMSVIETPFVYAGVKW